MDVSKQCFNRCKKNLPLFGPRVFVYINESMSFEGLKSQLFSCAQGVCVSTIDAMTQRLASNDWMCSNTLNFARVFFNMPNRIRFSPKCLRYTPGGSGFAFVCPRTMSEGNFSRICPNESSFLSHALRVAIGAVYFACRPGI